MLTKWTFVLSRHVMRRLLGSMCSSNKMPVATFGKVHMVLPQWHANGDVLVNRNTSVNVLIKRYRKRERGQDRGEEEKEEDDDDDDTEPEFTHHLDDSVLETIGGKELIVNVLSLRVDAILKAGLSTSRTKMEEAFYGDRIRINGKAIKKKSTLVSLGDEVDLVIGNNDNAPNLIDVSRIIVVGISFPSNTKSSIIVKLRRHKSLMIEDLTISNQSN